MRITQWTIPLVLAAAMLPASDAHAIPAWARKYNMNCSGCHAPAVPRLNAKGFAFKWAGYRLPEEIGENQEVKQISDYLAARLRFQYAAKKTETKTADANAFALGDATIFIGGSFGKNYGAFFEFEHAGEIVELVNNVYGVWGKADEYYGARIGQMHWLLRGAVAGFDRPTGLGSASPLSNPLTKGGVPFAFATDQLGIEAFWVKGKNRLSFEVLNGISAQGKGDEVADVGHKDFVVIDQFLYDDNGSGVTAVAYFGAISGLDTLVGLTTSRYTRYAVSANKIFGKAEIMGGYAYGEDTDLPVGTVFSDKTVSGSGFWGYGGYTFPSTLTVFGRYDYVNSNSKVPNSGNDRFVLGGVLPVNLPEYIRLTAEYTLDVPHASGGLKRHGLAIEFMLNF